MWNLPGPGIEPESPALAGGFLATACQGSPFVLFLILKENLPVFFTIEYDVSCGLVMCGLHYVEIYFFYT